MPTAMHQEVLVQLTPFKALSGSVRVDVAQLRGFPRSIVVSAVAMHIVVLGHDTAVKYPEPREATGNGPADASNV